MDICLDDALKLDFLNGDLSEQDRIRFEEHLALCQECRREMDEVRETAAEISGLTRPLLPAAWTASVKDRLRAKRSSLLISASSSPAPVRRKTGVFQYAAVTAGVTAGLALLLWLATGGTVERWLPGLSTGALGIADPRTARTVDIVAAILSLHCLLFVPSIIDRIYRLLRKGSRSEHHGSSAGFSAC